MTAYRVSFDSTFYLGTFASWQSNNHVVTRCISSVLLIMFRSVNCNRLSSAFGGSDGGRPDCGARPDVHGPTTGMHFTWAGNCAEVASAQPHS